MTTPTLRVVTTRGDGGASVRGFHHLWLRYVRGFNAAHHCARGLVATRDPRVTPGLVLGETLELDLGGAPVGYLCGVSPRWETNLHVPFRPKRGGRVLVPAYGDQLVVLTDVELLPIPALPDGFEGLPRSFTTCRNYQFGLAHFGAGLRAAA